MSIPPSLDALRAGLASAPATARVVADRPGRGGRSAAVLILLSGAPAAEAGSIEGLSLVTIEKSPHLRSHAGQIAFPGGAIEPDDASPVAAALREAREEVGVEESSVEVLGMLPAAHVVASGFDVASVVGWWRRPVPLRPVDLHEVAAVHVPLVSRLVDPANRRTSVHPSGHRGPAFVLDDLFIWGFTGHLLDGLLRLAGWEEPWDRSLTTEIPDRFLHGRRWQDRY